MNMYQANRRQTLRLTAPQDAGYAEEKISKRPVNSARYLRFPSDWVCILRTTSYTEPTTRDAMLRYGRICSSYRRNHGVVLAMTVAPDGYAKSVILEDVTE